MNSLIPRMMTAVSIVTLALTVNGCGGGSSKTPAPPAPTPVTVSMAMVTEDGTGYMAPQAGQFTVAAGESATRGSVTFTCAAGGEDCMVMVAADGMVTSTGGMVTAMNSMAYQAALDAALDNAMKTAVAAALDTSITALSTLAGPAATEGSARMMAMKYSMMIGTLTTDGNSMAATANARKVLDAKTMLEAARSDTRTKKTAAEAARMGLADDNPLAVLLDGAIMRADTQIGIATMVLEETGAGSLRSYVEMVTGTDMAMPTPAADKGREVAMAIAGALGPTDATDGAGLRVNHVATLPPDDVAMANRYMMDDAMGMTFAAIVGAGNLMDMRVAATGGGTRIVRATSVDGMKTMDLFSTVPGSIATADGTEIDADVEYRGIPGLLFCAGGDCMVEGDGDARTLTGSWYVAADNPMHYYMMLADDPETTGVDESQRYRRDTLYAIWGHWLTVAGNGDATVTTFARAGNLDGAPANLPGNWDAAVPADPNLSGTTATYNGTALGRSVHRTTDANGTVTDIQSGNFMADVMLTAKFSATPMLGGTIDNFRAAAGSSPGAVDSSWTVTLTETDSPGGIVDAGVTDASGQDGTWTATSFGEANMRPTGIYGGFNAHFTDGHAAGAFATREP